MEEGEKALTDIRDLVPNNKYDISTMDKLRQLTDEEIAPILPALLAWIQDMNWPVARVVLPVLALHQASLVPHILSVLSPEKTDEIWKYWIIISLLPLFSDENRKPILPYIERIAVSPTENERLEEVDGVALAFLQERNETPSINAIKRKGGKF